MAVITANQVLAESAASAVLPEPLGLDYVLQQHDPAAHPDLQLSLAQQQAARAQAEITESAYATEAAINLRARWIEPSSLSAFQSNTDHKASLNINKQLYDFGVTGRLEDAYSSLIGASELDADYASGLHRIRMARLYFDVLLSDLEYAWRNEAMAVAFIAFDKQQQRFELKQLDEISLLEEESAYQDSLAVRTRASFKQRVSRARLAESLGAPDNLPGDLVTPTLPALLQAPADPAELIGRALQTSPQVLAAQQRLQAAQLQYEADSSRWQPSLSADLEIAEYSRDLPSREDWRAGINLKVPLYESGQNRSQAALAFARRTEAQARLNQLKTSVREDIYAAWENISSLISRSQALATNLRFAERALDKSRGEYELEIRTDFGDSLVRISRARYDKASNDYELIIEKMQLALLLGEDPVSVVFTEGAQPNEDK